MSGILRRRPWLALGALLLGSAVNLAAGARRPAIERAILSADHYPAAAVAAQAVERLVPRENTVDLVVYDGDLLGELDCAVWADYRFKWLLYPRKVEVYRFSALGDPRLDPRYTELGIHPSPLPGRDRYLLFFRVTAPPEHSRGPLETLATGPGFILAREPLGAGAMGWLPHRRASRSSGA